MANKKNGWIKKILPKTLFGRSLLILVVPIFLIQIISTFIFFDRHWSKMTSRLAFAVAAEIAVILSYIDDNGEGNLQKIIAISESKLGFLITHDKDQKLSSIYNVGSKFIISSGWTGMIESTLSHELANSIDYPFYVNVDFQEKWVEVRIQLDDGVLNVSLPQRRLFSSTTYIFLIWIFCAAAILLLISILFMRNQIRPIRRLAVAAERFGKGEDVSNFKVEGAKEVRQAGASFLDMKERLERQISQRTDMLAGVSHDLRTPITRLKLQVSMMENSQDTRDIKSDIHDMEKMIEGYLNFVRGDGREESVLTDISKMLRDIEASVKRQGAEIELNLRDAPVSSMLRAVAFKRCLNNIVGNAMKYADKIWIILEKTGDNDIKIIIEDNGLGIDEAKYEEVFRPFYRVDSSRNISDGSVGLGLPIAMDIVHSHGGKIWLEKSKHGGLSVNIILPL